LDNHPCGTDILSKVYHWCSRSVGAAASPIQSHDPGSPDGQPASLLSVDTSTEESSGGISVCPQTRGSFGSSTVTSPGTSTDGLLGNPHRVSYGLSTETSLETLTETLFQTPSKESVSLSTGTLPGMSTDALERTTTGESASSSIAALPVKTMEILFRTQTRESIVSLIRAKTSEAETSLRRSPGSSMKSPTLEPLSTETSPRATTEHLIRTLTTEPADSIIRTSLEKTTEPLAKIPNRESSAATLHSKPTETQDRESTSLSSGKLANTSVRSLTRHSADTLHGRSAGTTSAALLEESPVSSKLAVSVQSESAEDKVLDSIIPASKPLRPALHETEAAENLVSLEESPRHAISLGLVSTAALSFGRQSYKR
jgi:hypothetical protein